MSPPSSRPQSVQQLQQQIAEARAVAARISLSMRMQVLKAFREGLVHQEEKILEANRADLEEAKNNASISPSLLKRLSLDGDKIKKLVSSIDAIIAAPNPIGKCTLATELTPGLNLYRVTVPLGVLLIIFEGRPEAFIQIAALGIKSGNVCLLKGGKEAAKTNAALYDSFVWGVHSVMGLHAGLHAGLLHARLSELAIKEIKDLCSLIQLIETREEVQQLLQLKESIDLVIPRGSKELLQYIYNNTCIPVMGHASGVCIAYADADCSATQQRLQQVVDIIKDSKMQYVAACNALEVLLVHRTAAAKLLPVLGEALAAEGVKFRADSAAAALLPAAATELAAGEEDFRTEWLAPILSIRLVDNIQEAIRHINSNGSHHTDLILSFSPSNIEVFMKGIDSADIFANCSTRFADGYRFGMHAEVGIATGKMHARGPVGIEGLCTYAYRLYGNGHTVAAVEAANNTQQGNKSYTHKPLLILEPSTSSNPSITTEEGIDAYERSRLLSH